MPPTLDYQHRRDFDVAVEREPPDGPASSLTIRVRITPFRAGRNLLIVGIALIVVGLPSGCILGVLTTIATSTFTTGLDPAVTLLGTLFFLGMVPPGIWMTAKRTIQPAPERAAMLRFTPVGVDAGEARWLVATTGGILDDHRPDAPPFPRFILAADVEAVEVVPPAGVGDADFPDACLLRVRGTNGIAALMIPTSEPVLQALAAEARRVVGLSQSDTD